MTCFCCFYCCCFKPITTLLTSDHTPHLISRLDIFVHLLVTFSPSLLVVLNQWEVSVCNCQRCGNYPGNCR